MKKCIQTDKKIRRNTQLLKKDNPLISILLSVYKPNEKWLIEQLISLNEQSYDNLNLYIYDDCPDEPVDEKLFEKYITNFKYKIVRGHINKGSNKAFEELSKIADGDYFAYCDQDDIWESDKLSIMMEAFYDKDVTLVCCDLCIIDEDSKKTHRSICDIRKRIVYKRGNNLAKGLLESNFVTGCAMLVKKEIALKAIPFEEKLIHDNWIAVIAALNGKIEFIDKRLVRYRQHGFNQTGILKGVHDKKSYYDIRIIELLDRYNSLKRRLSYNDELLNYINYCIKSIEARKIYFLKPSIKELKIMIEYSNYYKRSIILEIFMPILPSFIFKYIINITKKGIL